ncbi:hypothetical protein U1Q18_028041, partial [Sarracenia purpurea var. burkii]
MGLRNQRKTAKVVNDSKPEYSGSSFSANDSNKVRRSLPGQAPLQDREDSLGMAKSGIPEQGPAQESANPAVASIAAAVTERAKIQGSGAQISKSIGLIKGQLSPHQNQSSKFGDNGVFFGNGEKVFEIQNSSSKCGESIYGNPTDLNGGEAQVTIAELFQKGNKHNNPIRFLSESLSLPRSAQISRDVNGELGERILPCEEQNHPSPDLITETFPRLGDSSLLAISTRIADQSDGNQRPSIFAQTADSLLTEGMENKESLKGEVQAGFFPMEVDPQMAHLEGTIILDGIINPARKIYSPDQFEEQTPNSSNPPISAPGSEDGDLGVNTATKDERSKKTGCNQGKNPPDYRFSGKTEGDNTGHKEINGPTLKSPSPSLRRRKVWARQSRKIPKIKVQSPIEVQFPVVFKRHRYEDEGPEFTGVERKAKVQKSHSTNGE